MKLTDSTKRYILLNITTPPNANYVMNLLVLHIQYFVFNYMQCFINIYVFWLLVFELFTLKSALTGLVAKPRHRLLFCCHEAICVSVLLT